MIFRSHYSDVTIPEVAVTPFVLKRASQFASKSALIDGLSGRAITYSQLAAQVRHTARSLASRGYRKGDVFAIHSENLPEYVIAFHAIALIGGIVTTVNPRYEFDDLAYQLNDAGAKCLFTTSRLLDKARAANWNSKVREIFTFDHAEGAMPFVELFESVLAPFEAPTNALIDPRRDLVALPYSRAAGSPKGVMRTHYSLVANLIQLNTAFDADENDVAIAVIPFYQSYGMFMLIMHALWRGMTVVTLPRFDLKKFLRAVEQWRVTKAYLAAPILQALARRPIVSRYDLSSLNLITVGSSPQDEKIELECERRLKCDVRRAYGRVEQGPVNNINCGPDAANRRRSVGWLLPNVEARILDSGTGRALGANQPGELHFRGPHLMTGYLNRPVDTIRAIDSDGWSRTGDIGYVDDDGYFYLVGRVRNPLEQSELCRSHSSVESAAPLCAGGAAKNASETGLEKALKASATTGA
jgi:acyl-CoA synthetase (AMP-forming)/AMP-acid ligase II